MGLMIFLVAIAVCAGIVFYQYEKEAINAPMYRIVPASDMDYKIEKKMMLGAGYTYMTLAGWYKTREQAEQQLKHYMEG